MTSSPSVLSFTLKNFWPAFQRAWVPLTIIHLGGIAFHDYSNHLTAVIHAQGREDLGLLGLTMFFELVFETLISMLWMMVLIDAIASQHRGEPRRSVWDLISRFLNPLLIEYVRSLAAILFRVPLLIVPALLEYIRLLFVPLTVMLSPRYQEGRVDALADSRRLTKGHWTLLVAISLCSVIASIALDDMGRTLDAPWFWQNPLPAGFAAVLTLIINLVYGLLLFALYQQSSSTGEELAC